MATDRPNDVFFGSEHFLNTQYLLLGTAMDFDQLETFLEVARHLSLSRVAEKRFRTQPAISAQIRALEAEVGAKLLDRSGGLVTAGLYEIDRREKSTSATRERSLSEIEQRLQVLGEQIHILNNQLTAQMAANERQLQTLNGEVQALGHKYESRLKELEDALHVRR